MPDFNLLFQNPATSPVDATNKLIDNALRIRQQQFSEQATAAQLGQAERSNRANQMNDLRKLAQQQSQWDRTFALDQAKFLEANRVNMAELDIKQQNATAALMTAETGANRLSFDQFKFGAEQDLSERKFAMDSLFAERKDDRDERRFGLETQRDKFSQALDIMKQQREDRKEIMHQQLGIAMSNGDREAAVKLMAQIGQPQAATTYLEMNNRMGRELIDQKNETLKLNAAARYQGAVQLKQLLKDVEPAKRDVIVQDFIQEAVQEGSVPQSALKDPKFALDSIILNMGAAAKKVQYDGTTANVGALETLAKLNSPEAINQARILANSAAFKDVPNFSKDILKEDPEFYSAIDKASNEIQNMSILENSYATLKDKFNILPGAMGSILADPAARASLPREAQEALGKIDSISSQVIKAQIKGGGFGNLSEGELKFVEKSAGLGPSMAAAPELARMTRLLAERVVAGREQFAADKKAGKTNLSLQAYLIQYNRENKVISDSGQIKDISFNRPQDQEQSAEDLARQYYSETW